LGVKAARAAAGPSLASRLCARRAAIDRLGDPGAPLLRAFATAADAFASPGARERRLANETPASLGFWAALRLGFLVYVLCHRKAWVTTACVLPNPCSRVQYMGFGWASNKLTAVSVRCINEDGTTRAPSGHMGKIVGQHEYFGHDAGNAELARLRRDQDDVRRITARMKRSELVNPASAR
jgi:hypothetical protein